MSRRGRPPSSRWRDADEAIGHACAQLMHWGYSARSQAYPAVASAAERVFGRMVSAERVKQLYELWKWCAAEFGYREPGAFTKASRVKHRPEGMIQAQAEELLRGHRPGSLARLAQIRAGVQKSLEHDRQANTPARDRMPDELDDPRWFAVGGGVHPDDMNAQQRAAFDALAPHLQPDYRKFVESDAQRAETDERETREHWLQWKPYVLGPLDAVEELIREHGLYRLPGFGVRYVVNKARGKDGRQQGQKKPQGATARRRQAKARATVAAKVEAYRRKSLEDMARLTAEERRSRGGKTRK